MFSRIIFLEYIMERTFQNENELYEVFWSFHLFYRIKKNFDSVHKETLSI